MQIRRGVEAERKAQDLSVFELGEQELGLRVHRADVLFENVGERPIGDASAICRATACESSWRWRCGVQPIPQLAGEASLPNTRLAYDRDELGPFVPDGATVSGLQDLKLTSPTHECPPESGTAPRPGGRETPDETPTDDAFGLSFHRDGLRFVEFERATDSGGRALCNEDLAGSSGLLESGGDVDCIAARERASHARRSDDDLPGVDADPKPKTSPKQLLEPSPHREGCFERPLGVVLVGGGRTEHGHDGVAGELLDGAAGLSDFGRHRFVEAVEEGARPFGVLGVRKGRVADEVSKEDGRELAFDAALGRFDRLPARGAEPRCGGNRGPTLETCRHGMHSSATRALVPERTPPSREPATSTSRSDSTGSRAITTGTSGDIAKAARQRRTPRLRPEQHGQLVSRVWCRGC
jgi:hypothetical protein